MKNLKFYDVKKLDGNKIISIIAKNKKEVKQIANKVINEKEFKIEVDKIITDCLSDKQKTEFYERTIYLLNNK